jgi:hypothetical protein
LETREQLRQMEIAKLKDFGSFALRNTSDIPKEARVFEDTWVDTSDKSRVVVQDFKVFEKHEELTTTPIVYSPTPRSEEHDIFDAYLAYNEYEAVYSYVVSAFPHAEEREDNNFVMAPKEHLEMFEKENAAYADPKDLSVWLMNGALYGRRNAGASFEEFQEADMTEHFADVSPHAPCLWNKGKTLLLHHIDDGKIGGPEDGAMLSHVVYYMLLKVSQPYNFVPDRKHADAICGDMGVTANHPNKEVMQLSVERGRLSEAEQELIDPEIASTYREVVGYALY